MTDSIFICFCDLAVNAKIKVNPDVGPMLENGRRRESAIQVEEKLVVLFEKSRRFESKKFGDSS
jgi:hypothetical protein